MNSEKHPEKDAARCVHCAHIGPVGEDHTCPCPHSDDDCPEHDGCDCTQLCAMGPTCPGGMLARLPGSGCARAVDDLEAAEKRIADLEAQLAAARSALAAVREVREANR